VRIYRNLLVVCMSVYIRDLVGCFSVYVETSRWVACVQPFGWIFVHQRRPTVCFRGLLHGLLRVIISHKNVCFPQLFPKECLANAIVRLDRCSLTARDR
jgi:hypothetical protein